MVHTCMQRSPRFEVYLHRSPSGKAYVGFTIRGMRARWLRHVNDARRGSLAPFHAAIRKYGPANFTHEILDVLSTEAGAHAAERAWIAELGAFGPAGYNATTGGEGVCGATCPKSAEHRAKISASKRGRPETRAAASLGGKTQLGRKKPPRTPEHKAKLTAALVALAGSDRLKRGPMSAEWREKLSAAKRARDLTPDQRKQRSDAGKAGAHARWHASDKKV